MGRGVKMGKIDSPDARKLWRRSGLAKSLLAGDPPGEKVLISEDFVNPKDPLCHLVAPQGWWSCVHICGRGGDSSGHWEDTSRTEKFAPAF